MPHTVLWLMAAGAVVTAAVLGEAWRGEPAILSHAAKAAATSPVASAPTPPGTADALLKVADEHKGTKAAAMALLRAGAALFVEGKYAESSKTFERFLKEYPDSPWVPQAHYGIAANLDAQGKTADATTKFEQIRRVYGSDPIIDQVKLTLGRLYENQNKPEDAHKLYTEVLQANPGQYSGIGNEAGMRREELEAKYPQLAKTNAPILPPAITMLTNLPAGMTNRPAMTNRMMTLSNPPSATGTTNPAGPRGTNAPLLIQPAPGTPSTTPAPTKQ